MSRGSGPTRVTRRLGRRQIDPQTQNIRLEKVLCWLTYLWRQVLLHATGVRPAGVQREV